MPEKTLSSFEKAAINGDEPTFKNSVSGKPLKKRGKGKFKKKMPLIVFGGLLLLGAGLIFISQSLMPFAIINRFREEFNSIGISSTLRADNILDYQLEYAGGFLALSEAQRASFLEQEITPIDFTLNSSRSTALIFSSGTKNVPVVSKKILENSSAQTINSAIKNANSKIENLDSPISVEDALKKPAFKEKYITAAKIYRGGNSGWYDTLTNLTEMRLSISRSRYGNWSAYVLHSGEREAFRKLASSRHATDGGISDYGAYSDTDTDGNETTYRTDGPIDNESLTSASTLDEVRSVLNSKVTSVAKVAATAGCAGVEIISAIQTIMSVQQSLQYLNLATGYFEAVQKVQAGNGTESPVNEYNLRLTATDPETGKSAMNSAGIQNLFGGGTIKSDDKSVKVTNFETLGSSLGSLTGNLAFTAKAFETCSYVKMGVAGLNFATTILSFVPVLGQSVSAIHIVAKVVGKLALGIAIGEIVAFIVPKIVAQVAQNIISDAATEWIGEDLGNALTSGANKYLGGNFQTGGGSGASKEMLANYLVEKETVLAEEAEYERLTKSPFDLSSENTFFGSLMYGFIPIATTTSLSSLIKSFGNLITSSSIRLLPTASAVAETNLVTSIGDCPTLESAGMVGDAYCNPYFVTDRSTIKLSPLEIIKKIHAINANNFKVYNENGNVEINPDSNLGKYIKYCGQRNSSFGMADANIASDIKSDDSVSVLARHALGDVTDFMDALTEAENMPWISGSACSASTENPLWEENKYYQRFAEDQRLFESAGIVEKSAQTAMLEEYYEKNPLDNSYEGILARFSGMKKSDVIAVLDIIDGLTFIANYDAPSRLDFSVDNSKNHISKLSNSKNIELSYSEIPENRLYLVYGELLQQIRKRDTVIAEG